MPTIILNFAFCILNFTMMIWLFPEFRLDWPTPENKSGKDQTSDNIRAFDRKSYSA